MLTVFLPLEKAKPLSGLGSHLSPVVGRVVHSSDVPSSCEVGTYWKTCSCSTFGSRCSIHTEITTPQGSPSQHLGPASSYEDLAITAQCAAPFRATSVLETAQRCAAICLSWPIVLPSPFPFMGVRLALWPKGFLCLIFLALPFVFPGVMSNKSLVLLELYPGTWFPEKLPQITFCFLISKKEDTISVIRCKD